MDFIVIKVFLPEIFLSFCILFQLIFNSFLITTANLNFPIIDKETYYQTGFILFCLIFLIFNSKIEGYFLNFLFLNDASSSLLKCCFSVCCFVVLVILIQSFKFQELNFFEYFNLYLLGILSLLLLFSAGDMLSAYLIIEMQALVFYVLASFKRNSSFASEAGLKYFIAGSFASALFLIGCSIIYTVLGTLNLNQLSLLLTFTLKFGFDGYYNFVLIGFLCVYFTFFLKLAVVPFHFWVPDVYDGAPVSSTIIFSVIPKLALFHFFIKILCITLPTFIELSIILIIFGLFSIVVGTFFALTQKMVKRLIIYSSIAQIGFLIIALSNITVSSLISVYFFIFIYLITAILFWSNFSLLYTFQKYIRDFLLKNLSSISLSTFSNLFAVNSSWAFSFLIILFSIAGIPPLSGFFSKIFIILSLMEQEIIYFSFLVIAISIISTFYYLRLIKIIFFEPKEIKISLETSKIIFSDGYLLLTCYINSCLLFLLVYLFFYPSVLILICQKISIISILF